MMWHSRQGLTIQFRVRRRWQQLLALLYPDTRRVCALCQRPMGQIQTKTDTGSDVDEALNLLDGVCLFCLQDAAISSFEPWTGIIPVSPTERCCADGDGFVVEIPIFCAVTYEGIMRDTIRHWKYDGRIQFTRYLATLVAGAITVQQQFQTVKWDIIVPVPTSPDRWKKRGYHHVGLLAHELEGILGIPYQELLLRQQQSEEFTQSQTAKSASERKQSLQGQYRLGEESVLGKNIILVDDVVTTGATMAACSELLVEAGARQVLGIAAAHVE